MDTVITALVAGGLAGVFALAGIWYGSRREHAHWLRDARRKAYSEFSTAVTAFQLGNLVQTQALKAYEETMQKHPGIPRPALAELFGSPHKAVTNFETLGLNLFSAMSAVEIVGPAGVAEAARKVKDLALSAPSGEMGDADAEFVRLARKALGST